MIKIIKTKTRSIRSTQSITFHIDPQFAMAEKPFK